MEILWTIVVGFIVGVIAKLIHPGRENMGFIMTTLLGIAGAFLAGYVGQALGWYHAGQGAGFIGSIVGAFILLLIYGFAKGKAAS
ncbi:MAG: GlsB/YeaQ/YmgE family stress response membrane protein [Collimonas sp.]